VVKRRRWGFCFGFEGDVIQKGVTRLACMAEKDDKKATVVIASVEMKWACRFALFFLHYFPNFFSSYLAEHFQGKTRERLWEDL
jgi:hypothetical protein